MSELRQRQSSSRDETKTVNSLSSSSDSDPKSLKKKPSPREELAQVTPDQINELKKESTALGPKLDALTKRVDEELKVIEESEARRKLYVEIELLRLDYTELPAVDTYLRVLGHAKFVSNASEEQAYLHSSPIGQLIDPLVDRFDSLRLKLAVRRKDAMILYRFFHFFFCAFCVLASMPLLFALAPLRLAHPLFAMAGFKLANYPIDFMQRCLCRLMIACFGVEAYWEGIENIPNGPHIGMFTHQSSYDAFVICSGPVSYRLIGKKSLFYLPFIGQLAYLWGHIPIDRGNLAKAINSISKSFKIVAESGRSVGVFPEGTRSVIGRPIDMKKGSFHTAVEVGMPICPIIVYGAGELWYAKYIAGSPGEVYVRVLPQIDVKKDDTHATLRSRYHRAILSNYAAPIKSTAKKITNSFKDLLIMPTAYLVIYILYKCLF